MSGRQMSAAEALSFGLVSRVLQDQEELMRNALELASRIASKSPIAMLGVKSMLNFSRDHSVEDSMRFGLTWNAGMIQSKDVKSAAMGFIQKQEATFPNAPTLL